MRIRVEIDVAESEMGAASELLQVIRLLTENVETSSLVVNGGQHSTTAVAAAAGQAGPSYPGGVPVPAPIAAPAPPALQPPPPLRDQIRAVFSHLDAGGSNVQQVAAELNSALAAARQAHPGGPDAFKEALKEELPEAFTAAAFDPALLAARRSAAPFVHVVASLGEPFKGEVVSVIVRKTLSQVTRKRPEDAPRESYALQTEAFAAIVATGLVASLDGAVSSMERVLRKPDNRAVGLEVLCHIAQQCEDKLAAGGARPETLRTVLASLDACSEPRFSQQVAYLRGKLAPLAGAPPPPPGPPVPTPVAAPAAAPPPPAAAAPTPVPGGVNLKVSASLGVAPEEGAAGPAIFSLCYEPAGQQLVVGGQGILLSVLNGAGATVAQHAYPGCYVSATDVFPQQGLAVSAVTSIAGAPPSLHLFNTSGWAKRSSIQLPGFAMLSAVRCLQGSNNFVASAQDGPGQNVVAMWDAGAALAAGAGAQPVRVWSEHTDLVSTLAAVPGMPHLFVSGGRDLTMRVWDTRAERSVAALVSAAGAAAGTLAAHETMVSSVDAGADGCLLSGGMDGIVQAWDIRRLTAGPTSQPVMTVKIDGQPIVKLALENAPHARCAAVATMQGLYALDLSAAADGSLSVARVLTTTPAADATSNMFNDVRWGTHQGRPALFAACSDRPRVEVCYFA